jgi:hypothetical protein
MRLTVDLDNPSELQLLKTYFNCKRYGIVEVCISSGGKGYHMIVSGLKLTLKQVIELRRTLGDDENRIFFDEMGLTYKPKQVLFTGKGKNRITWIDEKNILALPWWSQHGQKH